MSFLKKLFGGGGSNEGAVAPEVEPIEYDGFLIYPEPIKEGSAYRIAARIEKEIDGELKSQNMVRADMVGDQDAAVTMSTNKAKQVINERGDALFDGPRV